MRKVLCPSLLFAVSVLAATATQAEVYITTDYRVATGNAWNSSFGSQQNVYVGQASGGTFVSGVDLDIVAGAFLNGDLRARGDSRTTVYGGSFTHYANGYLTSGLTLTESAQVRLAGSTARFGVATVDGTASLTMENGRLDGIQVHQNASARVTGGLIASQNSFTVAEANGAGAHLALAGGQIGGIVRAAGGGSVDVSGGSYSNLLSYNGLIEVSGGLGANNGRLGSGIGGLGKFRLYGSDFALSNAQAGSYYDPTYWISGPGVSYVLTGTLLNGQAIRASYFEEGLSLGQAPRNITFAASPVPEPAAALMLLAALPVLGWAVRRRQQGAAEE